MVKISDKVAALFCADALGGIPGPVEHQNAVQALRDWAEGKITREDLYIAQAPAFDSWERQVQKDSRYYGYNSMRAQASREVGVSWIRLQLWADNPLIINLHLYAMQAAKSARHFWAYLMAYEKWGTVATDTATRFWDAWSDNLILFLMDQEDAS